jgi:hypothetical protein
MLKVGELLNPDVTRYQETSWFNYDSSGPVLLIAASNLKEKEIEAIKTKRLDFALYETNPILWFLYKIDGFCPWSDCPFSIHLAQNKVFDWSEEISPGMGIGLTIILVDARTGIVKALRLVGLSTDFSKEFRAMILRQTEQNFDKEGYMREVNRVYATLSTIKLLERASIKTRILERK